MPQSYTKPRKLLLHERVLILMEEAERSTGYTCDEIARELPKRTYAGNHTITPAAINAAMSGISHRARSKHYVTDGNKSADDQWWDKRRWSLSPEGRTKVIEVRKELASGLAV